MKAEQLAGLPHTVEPAELSAPFPFHSSYSSFLRTTLPNAFDYLDDPKRLGSHMEKSSWMMAGSHMDFDFDAGRGQEIGSVITLRGKMMGVPLFIREAVVERTAPMRKVWATTGLQKMIIIDQYRMGFELSEFDNGVNLRVFLDYSLPKSWLGLLLGKLLGGFYGRWCTRRMAVDAAEYFSLKG